jgi:hypothetical protein
VATRRRNDNIEEVFVGGRDTLQTGEGSKGLRHKSMEIGKLYPYPHITLPVNSSDVDHGSQNDSAIEG